MVKYKEKLELLHELEKLRTQFVICGAAMEEAYGKNFQHAPELYGAADITQDWIKEISNEISQ